MMKTFAEKILAFYDNLRATPKIPEGIHTMNPYTDEKVMELCEQFYEKYYGDASGRIAVLGINPGRFGGGVTGIPFTDPIKLGEECGVDNNLDKKPELSSTFIYRMINAYGGTRDFYGRFFIGAVCPLGFTREGKNLNYYDDKQLLKNLKGFISEKLKEQVGLGLSEKVCICLGEGKNFKYLQELNSKNKFFNEIIALPHPRYIMQYKRKELDSHIERYLEALGKAG